MPVIGFLNSQSPDGYVDRLRAFRHQLHRGRERGDQIPLGRESKEELPALAAELVRRQVASIGLTSATLSNSCTKIRKRIGQQTGRTGHIRVGGGSSPLRSTTPISANRRFP